MLDAIVAQGDISGYNADSAGGEAEMRADLLGRTRIARREPGASSQDACASPVDNIGQVDEARDDRRLEA